MRDDFERFLTLSYHGEVAHAAATQEFIEAELRGDSGNTTKPIEDF